MPEVKARQIVLAARPQGRPKLSDFRLEETPIRAPSEGQILLRVQYLSLDPYMRGRMDDRKSNASGPKLTALDKILMDGGFAKV
jgi:NADPH-dependent curcumin reductase